MLYVVMCAAGTLPDVPRRLLPSAVTSGWNTYALATDPAVASFPEAMEEIENVLGRPVRSDFHTTVGYSLPDPDAVLVVPATFNTVVKMAQGVADTYILTRLAEQIGRGVPMVVAPRVGEAFAAHPIWDESVERLKSWGVRILDPDDEDKMWLRLLLSIDS